MLALLKQHWKLAAGALALIAAFAAGYGAHRPAVVTQVEYKDRIVTQQVEKQVVVEKPVIQYRDRVVTRYVTRPDGTKIETHVEEQSGRETGEKTTTTEEKTQVDERQATKLTQLPAEPPRLHLFAEIAPTLNLGPGPVLGANAMVGGLYDFVHFGPVSLYTGLEVLVPVYPHPYNPAFIVPLGISISR